LDLKPNDLDSEGRLWATLINIIINGTLLQVYYARVKVAWLEASDVMLPLAKDIQGGPKKRGHPVISLLTSEILLRSTRFFAEIKAVSFLTRKRNLLKLIMYNSGAIWRI